MTQQGYCPSCGGILSFYFMEGKTIFFFSMTDDIPVQQKMYDNVVYSCRQPSPVSVHLDYRKKLINI